MTENAVVIVAYARTPFARAGGALSALPAHRLGALAVDELLRRAAVDPEQVDGLYAGLGLAAGVEARLCGCAVAGPDRGDAVRLQGKRL